MYDVVKLFFVVDQSDRWTIPEFQLWSPEAVWCWFVQTVGAVPSGGDPNIWHGSQWDVLWSLPRHDAWTSDTSETIQCRHDQEHEIA